MVLLNPILLAGSLFVLVPIVIHLLNRSRYRIEPFGGMLFLRQAMAVRAQKLKLRQLILLFLRCLLLVLLAFALARPVVRPRAGRGGDEPTTHILVLDGSLSMTQGEGTGNVFHQARERALALVEEMGEKDNIQIIWGARKPVPLFPAPAFDKVYIQNRLRSLQPLAESMNVPLALEQAFCAADSSRLPRSRIYVLTDGQANGWHLDDDSAWERVKRHRDLLTIKPFVYVVRYVPGEAIDNKAVASITALSPVIDIFRPTRFSCELRNYGSSRQRTKVRFLVDGVLKSEREIVLPPGSSEIRFEHKFTEAGSHYVMLETGEDGLSADDKLVKAVVVMRRIRVLIIEGRSDENPWKADGSFLKMALAADGESRDAGGGLFDVVVRPQEDMDLCGLDYLRGFQCVVLADVASVSDFFLFGLERFVEAGGGLLIGVGNGAVASEYKRIFKDGQGVMPACLKQVEVYDKRYFQPTFPAGSGKEIIDCFESARTHMLSNVNVARFWGVEPAENASVVAHFEGHPFLVTRDYGKGRTMLWTTSLNPEWSNFVLTPDFLPLIRNLVIYLSGSVTPPVNIRAGESLLYSSERPSSGDTSVSVSGPEGVKSLVCTITLPSGEQRSCELKNEGNEWLGNWSETGLPGLYTFETDYFKPRYFAVRPDPAESDLREISTTGFDYVSGKIPEIIPVERGGELAEEIRKEIGAREWWQPMALAVLLLLVIESLISWRWSV